MRRNAQLLTRANRERVPTAAVFCPLIFGALAVARPSLTRIESLPEQPLAVVYGVSDNGTAVAGQSGNDRAFRWTSALGLEDLGRLPNAGNAYATDISSDGLFVCGGSGVRAFRWTPDGGMLSLGTLDGDTSSTAYGISADGSVVVGRSDDPEAARAFRWIDGRACKRSLSPGAPSRPEHPPLTRVARWWSAGPGSAECPRQSGGIATESPRSCARPAARPLPTERESAPTAQVRLDCT